MALHGKVRSTLMILSLSVFLYYVIQKNYINEHDFGEPRILTRSEVLAIDTEAEVNALRNVTQIAKRDGGNYSCKKGTPCKTYACCGSFFGGDTGVCGFGPTFCGDDCDSQCDAKPECGQYADPPDKKCPLNVCCSEYGFCGSTPEFCQEGCQSNCVVDPPVPPGGSGITVLNNRIIGYYEAWSARRECREFPPSAIPTEGLTHVNFAFAYIDPDSLQVTAMDSETPAGLFAQTTDIKNLKSRNSQLEVFVSIGGWTFSDNETATQPLFPEIAADASKRQKFADNLVGFMIRYGFDGVDLDWEYPGAPDRGGLEEDDIANFVKLLETLRKTFQASARGDYGLTFTIPTSYWYLRWFDVPGLLEYADWANMMSYDLHGVWDEHNPIGSIVQSHTNLTEIKLAADLLWRNNVPPGKVVLGIGFYGRSFQLKDSKCSTPGCQFKGPADEGSCTKSAGTLAYFEIQDIISEHKPKVVYDEDAAANYIVYGDKNDQWISYDDAKTLKQKVDWANEVGLGGVMIWSVDQDDDEFSALEGLIGEPLPSFAENLKRTAVSDGDHWSSVNGQACKVSDCENEPYNPPSGFSTAPNGKFPDTCGGKKSKYILCPTDAMPQQCEWRGSGSCHGQCHEGEVTLAHSRHGSESCLRPGQQAFCCVSNTWSSYTDKCGWLDDCSDCPSDRQYSVSTRKKYSFFSSCDQHFCCPYPFENCHWVGKGTCDDNECSATDVEVGLDVFGKDQSSCTGEIFNHRQKVLCCNTPKDLNPFLPASLDNLFPTLPPTGYLPAFDQQNLNYNPSLVGENPNPNAFFFVVIDGPPSAVNSLNRRDGSHVEFISRGVHDGQEPQVAHFVCMVDSVDNNCDAMHENGIKGTILRMPDDMGFAQWSVAHSVRESNLTIPSHLSKRVPPNAKVWELEYSYNFSNVRRDVGDIYFRVDYSDNHKYYHDVVQAAHQKRGVEPRFWSKISSVWKTILDQIRGQFPDTPAKLNTDHFNTLILGDDGSDKGCNGPDGFLKVNLAGSIRNTMRFGFTLVGTIQPFALEEAYGYFDSDIYMSGQLEFDGKGILDINSGAGAQRNLFPSPITKFQASHPGIVSFSPELNPEISIIGSGEIDGKFAVSFEAGSSKTMKTHAPPGLATFDGDILGDTISDAADGFVKTDTADFNTVFAINLNVETTMNMKIFGYQTSLQDAGARFTSRTPHAIRVIGNTGTGEAGILDAPQQGSSDVIQVGTVMDGWDDGVTHGIGSQPNPRVVLSGGDEPSTREVPHISGYPVFGISDFISCSGGSYTGQLVCFYNISANDTSLEEPSPPFKFKREYLEPLSEREKQKFAKIEPRAGPSSGSSETYRIYEYPENPNGNTNAFEFVTPTYPAGDNGDALDHETGRNERYSLLNPGDCEDTSITANGVQGLNWDGIDSDHPDDRTIFPTNFANFAQSGEIDLADGQGGTYRTQRPLFDFTNLLNYFAADYRTWVPQNVEPNPPPGSAAGDVADAMGSTNNPSPMVNLERNLNILKGRMYTTQGLPTSDDQWDAWMRLPSQGTAQAAFSALRAVFGVMNYLRAIQSNRQQVFDGRREALAQFDDLYGRTFPNRPERLADLIDEFQPQWEIRVTNFVQRYVTSRLNSLVNTYTPLAQNGHPNQQLALDVLAAVGRMRNRIQNELHF
ncbi:chitotriosidase-1 [Annulohypoxylon maeteangense]|uniref:chitotriosidase-1 n=1 Tax=Annulohypoxylon maeteangense TaxID=1927788 RepID=UPI0020072481|nr:chitotriosidase-1 [Annulohypoxylon maeteangense]KAI0890230.1 chitotriosidase-1 [Annulohypoxylon maeteangense]